MKKTTSGKRYDFIPNKLNKYSIRKFTVGTTSILIGSLLFLGQDAQAAVSTTSTEQTSTTNASTDPTSTTTTEVPSTETITSTTKQPTIEAATTEQPTIEAATTEQPTTETVTTEAPTNVEKATDLNFNADNTELTGKATAGDTVELTDANGQVQKATVNADGTFKFTNLNIASGQVVEVTVANVDNVKSDVTTITANSVAKADDPTTEAPTTEVPTTESSKDASSTESVTTEQPTTESATTEAPSVQEPTTEAPSTEVTTETPATDNMVIIPTTESVDAVATDITSATTEADKTAVLTDYVADNLGVTSEEAQATVESMNLDVNTLTSDELMAGLLGAIADQQNAGTVVATPVSTTSNTEMMKSISLAEIDTSTLQTLNGVPSNVNSLITSNTTLTPVDASGDGTISPLNDYVRWQSSIAVNDAVEGGDYFTINYSDTLQVYGANPEDIKLIGDIIDPVSKEVIATASHDVANNLITYTFTDYVDRFQNVQMGMDYSMYLDTDSIPTSSPNVPLSITVGNTTTTTTTAAAYPAYPSNGSISVGSTFTEVVSHVGDLVDPGYYEQTIYVNPLDNNLNGVTLDVVANNPSFPDNIGQINPTASTFKVYQVPEGTVLNQGYYVDPTQLIDVTNSYLPTYSSPDTATFYFGNITTPFIVVATSQLEPTTSETPSLVQMAYLSDDSGAYKGSGNALQFTNNVSGGTGVTPTYSLGNLVWDDKDHDGIQDVGEYGVPGVTVTVKDSAGTVVGTTTTNSQGSYIINNLPDGNYTVEFTDIPTGYVVSPSNSGTDSSLDSNGLTSTVKITGADNLTADLGIYQPTYSLGDYVWIDGNTTVADGIQGTDATEGPYEGMTVNLYTSTGTFIASTTTDNNGHYQFDNLTNGTYQVEFVVPEGLQIVQPNQGNDLIDSDLPTDGSRVTAVINNANNMSIDAGLTFYEPVPVTYELGDYVWNDYNADGIQNSGEGVVSGVTVTLTKPDGTTVTTTTDATGHYVFTGLENGDYTVTFSDLPAGYTPTATNVGDPALDSNGLTSVVTINNANNYTADLGIVAPEVTPTPVPATYELGDYVWIDSNGDGIQNSNETPV
ncbi:SdrD B-like domain-containing protein, partial [Macrococcoides caseolyticum]|uniref:SdrD B-like domain-containing protein n=1 Tax=Macrococcoides caseolyticum TaxID=69966 RepID=UPI001F20DC26